MVGLKMLPVGCDKIGRGLEKPVGCCDKNGGGESELEKGELTGFVGTKPLNPV